jgi:regulator of sirC expression with transglutaminase-like and TPR domain
MALETDLRNEIVALAALPDHEIGLARAALAIARLEYPDLDPSAYMDRLAGLAAGLKSRIGSVETPEDRINELNRLLFDEEGFRGNRDHYYDPRNSFLNEVLDRKLGIPVTLSIVYIEVGRRADLPLYGIGFPGHFFTGLLTDSGNIFIDPFQKGKLLSEDDCRDMFRSLTGGRRPFDGSYLAPAWPKEILVRLLRNLKAVYLQRSQELKALRIIEWILILAPDSARELRERGLMYDALGDVHGAINDLKRYLELSPDAEDAENLTEVIERLKTTKFTVH